MSPQPPSTTDSPASALLASGTRLGRYEVLRAIGSGAMGQVYLARSSGAEGFQKVVALKRVLANHDTRSDFSEQLLQEARLTASLHHPNIAQVYDAGVADGVPFFVMEYIHGESLTRVLTELARRGRGLSLKNALWIVSSVAAGLHYAHEKLRPDGQPWSIVHRDVSPRNIMLTFDGSVKLIDFGVAKAVAQPIATRPGLVKGNLRYMSPEQFLGAELSRKSDLFSLGIVLFELTTGTRWQRERDDYTAAQAMLHAPLPKPSERRAGYPTDLEMIVTKTLARDPQQRFATTLELQQALEAFAQTQGLSLSNIELGESMRQLFSDRADMSTERDLLDPGPDVLPRFGVAALDHRPLQSDAPAHGRGQTGTLLLTPDPSAEAHSAGNQAFENREPARGGTLRLSEAERLGQGLPRDRVAKSRSQWLALTALGALVVLSLAGWLLLH